jgi:hypothetical protein
MDDRQAALREKLDQLLREAARSRRRRWNASPVTWVWNWPGVTMPTRGQTTHSRHGPHFRRIWPWWNVTAAASAPANRATVRGSTWTARGQFVYVSNGPRQRVEYEAARPTSDPDAQSVRVAKLAGAVIFPGSRETKP